MSGMFFFETHCSIVYNHNICIRLYQHSQYSALHFANTKSCHSCMPCGDAWKCHRDWRCTPHGRSSRHTVNCADESIQIFKLFVRNDIRQGDVWWCCSQFQIWPVFQLFVLERSEVYKSAIFVSDLAVLGSWPTQKDYFSLCIHC